MPVTMGPIPDDALADILLHKVVPKLGLLATPIATDGTKKVDRHVCHHPSYVVATCSPDHHHNPSIEAGVAAELGSLRAIFPKIT